MTHSNLEQDIRRLVADILETDPARVPGDAALVEDLGMDSMRALEILAALEQTYGITIPEEELPQIGSLNDAVALTRRYLEAAA